MYKYLIRNLNANIFEYKNILYYGNDKDSFAATFSNSLVSELDDANQKIKYDLVFLSTYIESSDNVSEVLREIRLFCDASTKIVLENKNHIYEGLSFLNKYKSHWFSDKDIIHFFNINNYLYIKSQKIIVNKILPGIFDKTIFRFIPTLPWINIFSNRTLLFFKLDEPNNFKKYSVIIPTRNERGNILDLINRFRSNQLNYELIFVDGDSCDGTYEELIKSQQLFPDLLIQVYKQKSTGKGGAVREGFEYSSGDVIAILDADISVPPESMDQFCELIQSGRGDFINGTRLVYSMEKNAMQYLNHIANKVFSIIFTWLFDQRYTDTLCGTKVISRENFKKIINKRAKISNLDPFGDFDLLVGANLLHLKTVEVPILYESRKYGKTNISRFKHGFILIKMIFEIYFKHKLK
jgi:hypothetical protein